MAGNIEKYDETIGNDIEFIRLTINSKSMKNAQPLDKEKKIKELLNKLRTCSKVMSNWSMEFTGTVHVAAFQEKYDEKNRMLKDLEIELKTMKDQLNKEAFEIETHDAAKITIMTKPIDQLNKHEAMERGDKLLLKADQDLDEIHKILVDGRELQNQINAELARMEEQLLKAEEAAKDTQSLLKRSAQLINYFKRQLQTDKIIWCCLIVVVLLVLAVIIMSIAGVKSEHFNAKVLPNQGRL